MPRMSNVSKKSVDNMQAVASRLANADGLLLITHGRPDGDGLGSMSALAAAARAMGKRVEMLVPDVRPPKYTYLFEEPPCESSDSLAALADKCDLVVVLDTCAFAQLDGLEEQLRARRDKVVVVDHHASGDDVGALIWQDTSAAACGVMVAELLVAMDWPIGSVVAESLMTAITTDTGWLKFANTDARTLRVCADLVDKGVRLDKLYRKIYQTNRPQRLALMGRMFKSLELHCDDRLAAMTIRQTDFEETGARPNETENLVNEALELDSVETAILLVENTDTVRVSLRSREVVNVAAVARQFGGGGHKRAAGLRSTEDVDVLKDNLIAACAAELTG